MHKIVYKSQCVFRTRFLILNFIMEPLIYAHEFARYGLKSYMLITTRDVRNENFEYLILKKKDGQVQRCVHVPFEVMTVMLNLIEKAIDILDKEREWLSRMAFGLFAEKFYKLFCIRVYANGGNE